MDSNEHRAFSLRNRDPFKSYSHPEMANAVFLKYARSEELGTRDLLFSLYFLLTNFITTITISILFLPAVLNT